MDIKHELVRHYHWLRHYGYNDSHSGNASIRDNQHFWVTATGACADLLEARHLVQCNLDGRLGEKASLDAELHRQVYLKQPKAQAILHSHGAYSVAATLGGDDFHPIDFEGQYYFSNIPVINIPYDRYLELAAEAVSDVLAEYPITVVRGHGVYAWADTMNLAYKWTCSFELSAKTWLLAKQAGTLK